MTPFGAGEMPLSTHAEEIYHAALALPREDRVDLLEKLTDSID